MNNFRTLSIQEMYFSHVLSKHDNQAFSKNFTKAMPDSTATIADLDSSNKFIFGNKQVLIAGAVILIVIIGAIVYYDMNNQNEKKVYRNV